MEFFSLKDGVLIADTAFKVASATLRSAGYGELLEAEPLKSFRLVFRTPTYLSSIGSRYEALYPEPVQVFSNLMRVWDAFRDSRVFEEVAFDNVNPHSGVKILRDKHIVTKPYLFPIRTLTKESIYVIY